MLGQSSNPLLEEGEDLYMMVGDFLDDPRNNSEADHRLVKNGYISVVAHNLDCTDYEETKRLTVLLNRTL
jgi:broad specificity polyphosphatase/5'/3'-nucleotidase SurE